MASALDRAATVTAQPIDATGTSFIGRAVQDRFRIEATLGEGGMGTVYRARHLSLDRPVALKVLRKQHQQRWVSRQRFEREARALAKLDHDNVVSIIDFGVDDGSPFLVMELLEGEALATRLQRGRLPRDQALSLAAQLLEGLAFAHERGLVHRDVKPGNVFVQVSSDGRERLKLLDFGLAKFVVSEPGEAVTRSGEVWGTPAYMAPEQITGEPCTPATDVYSAGLLLFEMLAGQRPFLGNEVQVMQCQVAENLPPLPAGLGLGALEAPLNRLLQKATRKPSAERFAGAAEMAAALRELSRGERAPAAKRRSGRPGVGGRLARALALTVSVLALLGIAVFAGLIYLLEGPKGPAYRSLIQSRLPGLVGEASKTPSGARDSK